jgi:long-subunit acyl-CoA synthetase (AMP-forming)
MTLTTVPGLVLERASVDPKGVALRFFRQGKWNELTNAGLRDKAAAIGSGLADLGVREGDVVVVVCGDGPVALCAEFGAQGIGARVLALDPNLSIADVCHQTSAAGAVVAIVGDQEQYDKFDENRELVPSVRSLIVDSTRGLRSLEADGREDRNERLTLAQLEVRTTSENWVRAVENVRSDSPARVVVADALRTDVTHEQLIDSAKRVAASTNIGRHDIVFALQPVANASEYALFVAGTLMTGSTSHFGGSGSSERAIRQVQPTLMHASPDWVSRIDADVKSQIDRSRWLKKLAVSRGFRNVAPSTTPRGLRNPMAEPTRLIGLACAAAIMVFLFVSIHMNDVLRIAICFLIAVGFGLLLVLSGQAVAGPLRRRYGLSRCRALLASRVIPSTGLLDALGVPVVLIQSEVNS